MIEIKLLVDKKVVAETLSRIGIANRSKKVLFPSCYIWENENNIYICHFKELFSLTKSNSYDNMSEDDTIRVKAIAWNLVNWGLIEADSKDLEPHNKFIFVLGYKEKHSWEIQHKFNFKNLDNKIINN